jgi:hypothetical protein
VAQYLHAGRLDIKLLGDFLADRGQLGLALVALAAGFVDLVDDVDSRELSMPG